MGSMLKADSERQELVRERRQARIERKQQRRDARERKRARISGAPPALSAMQRSGQEQVDAAVDRIVSEALERHDRNTATANSPRPASAAPATPTLDEPPAGKQRTEPAQPPAGSQTATASARQRVRITAAPVAADGECKSRRDRDIAAFRERRRRGAGRAGTVRGGGVPVVALQRLGHDPVDCRVDLFLAAALHRRQGRRCPADPCALALARVTALLLALDPRLPALAHQLLPI